MLRRIKVKNAKRSLLMLIVGGLMANQVAQGAFAATKKAASAAAKNLGDAGKYVSGKAKILVGKSRRVEEAAEEGVEVAAAQTRQAVAVSAAKASGRFAQVVEASSAAKASVKKKLDDLILSAKTKVTGSKSRVEDAQKEIDKLIDAKNDLKWKMKGKNGKELADLEKQLAKTEQSLEAKKVVLEQAKIAEAAEAARPLSQKKMKALAKKELTKDQQIIREQELLKKQDGLQPKVPSKWDPANRSAEELEVMENL